MHSPKTMCLLTAPSRLVEVHEALLSQAVKHLLQGRQIGVLVLVTGLARVWNIGVCQGIFGQQGHKHVRMGVTGFRALRDSGHVAADAVGKRVN